MEDTIGIIIIAVIWIVAILGKFLSKFVGSGAVSTLAKTAEKSKGLLEALAGDEIEDLKELFTGESKTKSEKEQPERPPDAQPAARAAAAGTPVVVTAMDRAQRPMERPVAAAGRRIQTISKRERMERKAAAAREAAPRDEPPRKQRLKPRVRSIPVPEETRCPQGPRAAALLGRLRQREPALLREMILLREILGPPRALQREIRPGAPAFAAAGSARGAVAGAVATPSPPVPTGAEAADIPQHVLDMYRMGMVTREQFDELCEFHRSRQRGQ